MNKLFQNWIGKPPRTLSNLLLRRIQRADLRQLLKAAAPTYINDLLYIGEEPAKVYPHRLPFPLSIKSFSIKNLSGVNRIDERLTAHRLAYVVFCFGEIVHQSWVCFDTLTPAQYKFDAGYQ